MVISCSGEGLDHGGDRGGGLGQRGLQAFALAGDRVGGAGLLEALAISARISAGSASRPVMWSQTTCVEVVGADRLVVADPAALVAVVVGAQAPVVVDLLAGGAGRGAVVAVSAGRAGGQALQQGGDLGVAGGEPLVVGQPLGTRWKVSALTMAGTGISVHSSQGRSTVLDARGVVRPSSRARRFSPGGSCRTWSCRKRRGPRRRGCAACPTPPTGPSGSCRCGWGCSRW